MVACFLLLLAWADLTSPVEGCRALAPRFLDCAHSFASLGGRSEAFSIHLPENVTVGSTSSRPVILLLHGAGRHHRTLWEHGQTRLALEHARSVIVMPNGGSSWWLGQYAAYPLELLGWLSPRLGLASDPARRAVAGWSMGGFGSLRLIEQHPDAFSAWGGLLALADFPNPAWRPDQNHSVPAVFGPPRNWASINPMASAGALRGHAVWFLTATGAFDCSMNRAFDERLRGLNIPHEFAEVPGGHTFDVVAAHLKDLLDFLDLHITKGDR